MDSNELAALERIEEASNRTTRAVRAFVRFLFIQLSMTTAGTTVAGLGAALNWPILGGVGSAVILIGIVWSGWAGRAELRKSALPKD